MRRLRSLFAAGIFTAGLSTASAPAQAPSSALPVREIAFARDGRLAASMEGDIWIRDSGGSTWTQLTRGAMWDRQPAWSPDGATIVFVSDREGQDDLFRIRVAAPDSIVRVTTNSAPDLEPTVGADGTIWFVRGRMNDARLWRRAPNGDEARVTKFLLPERAPTLNPAGDRIAYIQRTETGARIRVRVASGAESDSVVTAERDPETLAWSPDGERIAFTSHGVRDAVYVTPRNGRYVNYIGAGAGEIAWSPDGRTILVAERDDDDSGYNGDPDRAGDRRASEDIASRNRLLTMAAPIVPDSAPTAVGVTATTNRATRNADAFDRFGQRIARVYFAAPAQAAKSAAWRDIVARLRTRAVSAPNDSALDDVMQTAISQRPTLREPAEGRAAVSSANPVATAAGVEMLQRGGNVVDAAVAVSFALGVVEPDASGIGGYGEMLVQMKGMERPALIEFMARVPEEATLGNAALMQNGRYPEDGPVLVMVPGTVAGMHTAWKRYGGGKLKWSDLLVPAIKAARDGYVVTDGLATTLWLERDRFAKYESSRALFFRDGKPLIAGDTIRNADLARTLDTIASRGADGFYRGDVADRYASDLRGKGNAMRATDLARYFAADRVPVSTTYRGYTIFGSAPPASGGVTLAAQLNNLEQVATVAPYTSDAATLHAMISAWQLVPSSRNRIADPGLWPVDISPFVSKDTARARWKCFDAAHAVSSRMFRGDTLTCGTPAAPATPVSGTARNGDDDVRSAQGSVSVTEPCNVQDHAQAAVCRAQGTTAFVVADGDGNAVAVTQTLGTWGGNFYVSPGLGFLSNDKLLSYGTNPSNYGARLPYARHGSSISPTIVFRGTGIERKPVLALGAAGNAWINAAVFQTLVGVLDFGLSPQRALELPRFLPSQRGGFAAAESPAPREFVIDIENGVAPGVLQRLRSMGHTLNVISLKGELRMGYGAAIAIGAGSVTAGADPRRAGTAGAVPK